ncbi:hypothetical protein [Clostridium algidicarnis]|uniref:hypothetical protein n=1 Tax=Clostridium algidicarnis TaxID=37659 RepID=UPI000495B742|nr:hypothetical protein [Clostridium algidicarnis]
MENIDVINNKVNEQNFLLKQNIELLEQGITLQEYLENEERIKFDGDTEIYNHYGFYVIYNKTRNLYLLDGGNSFNSRYMDTAIHMNFAANKGQGNPFMHQHYIDGDDIILKYHRLDNEKYPSVEDYTIKKISEEKYKAHEKKLEKFEIDLTKHYDSIGESYYDYVVRMTDYRTWKSKPISPNKYYSGNFKGNKIKSIAATLLQLKNKSAFLYEFLNAIVDLIIKSMPIFIWQLINISHISIGGNTIQRTLSSIFNIIGMFLNSIFIYLILLAIIQIIKLFVCAEKRLNIHFKVFNIIIKLNSKENN